MKELLSQYAKYNVWANKQVIDAVLKLEPGIAEKDIVSSFPSIRSTMLHLLSAENVWLQRLLLAEHPERLQDTFTGTLQELTNKWENASSELSNFVDKQYSDNSFLHVLEFYDFSKMQHKVPVYVVLNHVFNHSTYHRGQLITMLRQLGETKMPRTDFIVYASVSAKK